MTLEDHLGDVIRKARAAAGVSLQAVAEVGGCSVGDLESLESCGRVGNRPDFKAMAALLGLAGEKLEVLADGWLPPEVDLGAWRELRRIATTREENTVNCYLVWDEVSREAALFDTGWEATPIIQLIDENELQLKHLFLTHLHEDHVAAMGDIRARFPKLHLHTNSKTVPPQHRNRANDCLQLGSLRITNRGVSGHAEEGVVYVIGNWPEDAPHAAIVGDTLFAGSIAMGFQSWENLRENIRSQIFSMPAETLLCPGHGPLTTVAEEKRCNPFFA